MLNCPQLALAGALVLCLSPLQGQDQQGNPSQEVPAPDYMLDQLELTEGNLQKLVLPVDGIDGFEVEVKLGENRERISLRRHDMRAAGYKLLISDENGIREAEPGIVSTYRGRVVGDEGSVVAATLRNGQVEAVIHMSDGERFGIHPTRKIDADFDAASHVVYDTDDLLGRDVSCGVTAIPLAAPAAPEALTPEMEPLRVAEIALDCEFTYFQSNFSSIANTEADAQNVLNNVDVIYQRDVGIQYAITTIIVRTTAVYQQIDPGSLLNEFRQRWQSFHRLVNRDVAHLLFNKGRRGGTIGVAFLGTICNRLNGFGVSATRFSTSMSRRAGLTAHELGHNWGAGHCDAVGSACRIMCSGLGGCSGNLTSFGANSVAAITNHKNTRSCLSSPEPILSAVDPNAVTAFESGEIVLSGSNLGSVTSIDIGPQSFTSFVPEDNSTIRFTPDQPLEINFLNQITVTNSSGTSNPLFLTVTGNHPSVLVADAFVNGANPIEIEAHSDKEWFALLLASPFDMPSSFPGIVDLGIGDNFARLIQVELVQVGTDGAHTFTINMPASFPRPGVLHWQLVTLDGNNPAFPLEVSNTQTITIF